MGGCDAIILMGKAPVPGYVKTRLCPPLSPRRAAEFYTALLEDAAEETSFLRGVRRYLFFSPPGSKACFSSALFSGFSFRDQAGGDLGERMAHATGEVFADGARRAVMIGADCPALSAAGIRSAFEELRRGADAVVGPAEDGGVYLVGLSTPAPWIFEGIEWSTPAVLHAMLSRCRNACMTYALLAAERDVDTPEDLATLRERLRTRSRPACPRTREWLKGRRYSSPRGCPSWRRRKG